MMTVQRSLIPVLFMAVTGAVACSSKPTTTPARPADSSVASPERTSPPAREQPTRFDKIVQDDFFAGFAGNAESLARGMRVCDEALVRNPGNAPAHMWHAMGTGFLAGKAYRQGDSVRGRELEDQGSREAEQAVALAPDDEWVLIYYALDHSTRAWHTDDPAVATRLLEQATDAYERTERIQKPSFATLSVHDRGELLLGLADLWGRRGNQATARMYLTRATRELPGTIYATKAQGWLDRRAAPEPPKGYTCLSCHEEPT